MSNIDKIVNPRTGNKITKYGQSWFNLIKKYGYSEYELEKLPIIASETNITYTSRIKYLDLNKVMPPRAGCLLYTKFKNELYFGFGVDSTYNELTDFGGGISYKNDKNVINGAIREFTEETLDIIPFKIYDDNLVIYNKQLLIIFVYTNENPELINQIFYNKHKKLVEKGLTPEIKSIKWVSLSNLKLAMKNNSKLYYKRVLNFLKSASNFYDSLID